MMAKIVWKSLLTNALGVAMIYPLSLVPVLIADTFVGEAEFLRRMIYGSRANVAAVMANDWWSALPLALACWALMRLMRTCVGLRQVSWGVTVIAALALVLALVPPYLPMIFAAMALSTVMVNLLFECRGILR